MNPRLSALVSLFELNSRIFAMTLADLDDTEVRQQPAPGRSCPLWIAGHLAATRGAILRVTGADFSWPHADLFARGAATEPAALPPLAEVVAIWDEVSRRLLVHLPRLDDAALDRELDGAFPVPDHTMLGALAFFAMHDSYHLGQLGYLRTALGHPSIAG